MDATTGALRSRASDVRASDWSGEVIGEFQETQVEIGTPVCGDAAHVSRELRRLRFQAATAAAAEGLAILAAGTHPFSRWEGQSRTAGDRYERIARKYGRVAVDEHIFGMHVHVAVPSRFHRLRAINALRRFGPALLALSASSPFFEGEDTGYASYRSINWRRWPFSGLPPRFRSTGEYRSFVERQLRLGTLVDASSVYWSIRMHARYPTIEFRVTDVCPRVEDAVAIAALIRTLVFAFARGDVADVRPAGFSSAVERDLLAAAEWNAARHGLDARTIDDAGAELPLRTAIRRLLDTLVAAARELGDIDALAGVERILERGSGADRIRREHASGAGFAGLVDWLAAETVAGTGLDRRSTPRAARSPAHSELGAG